MSSSVEIYINNDGQTTTTTQSFSISFSSLRYSMKHPIRSGLPPLFKLLKDTFVGYVLRNKLRISIVPSDAMHFEADPKGIPSFHFIIKSKVLLGSLEAEGSGSNQVT